MRKHLGRSSIKEAFDNLPSGVCFFAENGIPVLCNKVMRNFVYNLTGRSLQTESDLHSIMQELPKYSNAQKDNDAYILPDKTVWKIYRHNIVSDGNYTEYFVEDITELYFRKQELRESTELRTKMVSDMKRIVENVVDLTREEEILTMKMQVHGKVGWFLQRLRNYHISGCPEEQKASIVAELRKITGSLYREVGNDDQQSDPWEELLRVAKPLGVAIDVCGEIPEENSFKNILALAVRECISNTVRHAEGNLVHVEITDLGGNIKIRITNNGKQPSGVIREGGGFSSLRKNLEKSGCTMEIESQPIFALNVLIKKKRRNST